MDYIQILIYIVIAVIIIAVLYYMYKHYKTTKIAYYESGTVVSEKQNARNEKMVRGSTVPSPLQGNEYAISMWLYINDYEYRYGQPKYILYKGVDKNNNIEANPEIFLHPTENTLMVRIKLQSETVNDPKSYMVTNNLANNSPANSTNNTNNVISNISGNNVNNVNNGNNGNNGNNVNNITANNVTEGFYANLGNNILDSTINYDHATHNYSVVDLGDDNKIENCQTQIKEMFEETNSLPLDPLSAEFISKNPFIATFRDRYSKATSDEERANIAKEYADKFVDQTKENKELIAEQFLKTLAHMFATTMGLKVVGDSLMSNEELEQQRKQSEMYDVCYLRNIPLQKWVNITVSVYQNNVDLYIDGKLGASHSLKGFPQPNKGNIFITPKGGFDGYIANTKFFNLAFTPDKAFETYKEGPSSSPGFFGSLKDKVWNS